MRINLKRLLSWVLLCTLLACAPAAASAPRFTDVPSGYWAASQISQAVQTGLFNGRTATYFGAAEPITRAEFTVALCRLFRWDMVTPSSGSFTDNQNPAAWYYSAVETAYHNGAVTRQSETFRPNDVITREELSVMLVRALGYTSIAGLTQDLPLSFRDVDSNRGYLSMAYELGITSGTSAAAFSPGKTASRAQAAVMLVRVYDKLHSQAFSLCGIAPDSSNLAADGMRLVAVPAAALTTGGSVALTRLMTDAQVRAVRAAASGAKAALYVSGSSDVLQGKAADTAAALEEAVTSGGYDGLFLDIRQVGADRKAALTELVGTVRAALGDKILYVMAEAPCWQGTAYDGYDYAALAARADRVVLRVAAYDKMVGGVVTAPQEPLEEVYYSLAKLKSSVDLSKVSLLLSTTGSDGSSGSRIAGLLTSPGIGTYYSARYAAAYLVRTSGSSSSVVLWYQDAAAAAARAQLCAFFGVSGICLSDLTSLGNYGDDSLLGGLTPAQ